MFEDLGTHIMENIPAKGGEVTCVAEKDEMVLRVRPEDIVATLTFLRDDARCHFKQLTAITAVDYPAREQRFDVIYQLLSVKYNQRIRIKVVADEQSLVPTVVGVFSCANWYEREVWDMYGIYFADHPDLRRILSDYGFEGHAQRKDFPLTGYVELRYDPEQARVVYEPVVLDQEYRSFDFVSPWEGTDYVLPGDEKAEA